MLRSMKQMDGFTVVASDGEVGTVANFLFDDEKGTVRYLVVDTGGWLIGRTVLLSPHAVQQVAWRARNIHVLLTKEQVENGPNVDTDKPVSRQYEASLFNHYGYPYYWTGPLAWGTAPYPMPAMPASAIDPVFQTRPFGAFPQRKQGDPQLRSADAIMGYGIESLDGKVGHVEDFLFDDVDWSIVALVVATKNWWPDRHVLLSLNLVERVSWEDKAIFVSADRTYIELSPDFDAARFNRG